jgi:hypothetical protein
LHPFGKPLLVTFFDDCKLTSGMILRCLEYYRPIARALRLTSTGQTLNVAESASGYPVDLMIRRQPFTQLRPHDMQCRGTEQDVAYCGSAGASVGSGLGAGLSAGVAGGVSAFAVRAAVRFGAARRLVARAGVLADFDLPWRAAVARRVAALLRFVVDLRLPALLVLVVFAFDLRAVLAMAMPPSVE